MKKIKLNLALAVFLFAGTYASAQTASADATARIVKTISMYTELGLAFGAMSPHATQNTTLTIAPSGTLSQTASPSLTVYGYQNKYAAYFPLYGGTAGETFQVTLPGTVTITSNRLDSDTMTVTSFTSNADNGTTTLNETGRYNLYVGGTLNISAGQPSGDYTGTFDVTVAYN